MMISERGSPRHAARLLRMRQKAVALLERPVKSELQSRSTALAATAPASRAWRRSLPASPLPLALTLLFAQSLAIALTGVASAALHGPIGKAAAVDQEVGIAFAAAGVFALLRGSIAAIDLRRRSDSLPVLLKTLGALGLAELAALGATALLLGTGESGLRGEILRAASTWLASSAAMVAALHALAAGQAERAAREGRLAKQIVVVGSDAPAADFIAAAQSCKDHLSVKGYFDERQKTTKGLLGGVPFVGGLDQLADYVREEGIDEVVIALPWSAEARITSVVDRLGHLPTPIRLAPEPVLWRAGFGAASRDLLAVMPVLRDKPISDWDLFVKNLVDRFLGSLALLVALPSMTMIALLIRLDSPGPVFFRQKRLGFNGHPFEVFKFRTMTVSGDPRNGLRQASRFDWRVTRVGAFLRRTSLDELPQLLNVLRGEMSLVGPRPHPMWTRASELWPEEGDRPIESIVAGYAARHRVRPGITGWAQVCGHRGETETVAKMMLRVEHDLHYIDNWSLWFDVKIMVLTLITVIGGRNAY